MEIVIDYDNINDLSKKEWLIHTLKLMGIKYRTNEPPQTLEQYNEDLDKSIEDIEKGDFVTADDLKIQASKW